ncbi:histidine phosphatase family protein [Aeromicrobium camelliae]|uniref:Histidine phosphatase family protein n=1 Tax=Aeromicrobium camelliae TaxID=1538144 RepID=A0A3N6ZNU6_9ACTN|nr:phosphoglycerate mutase family protein [Aeromicrobium camelliae]RQN08737.1 histidine phosphatase family protein [Aeromicrobium camelliae]
MIIWLRHGQSSWNAAGRMQYDALHPELTDQGRTQATAAASQLCGRGITALWSSPAVRAQQTAAIIAPELGLDVMTSDLLLEQSARETTADVADRIADFTAQLSAADVTLVVSHGDVIAIAAELLAGQRPGILPNAHWIETPGGPA